jgi:hypothetical protein
VRIEHYSEGPRQVETSFVVRINAVACAQNPKTGTIFFDSADDACVVAREIKGAQVEVSIAFKRS